EYGQPQDHRQGVELHQSVLYGPEQASEQPRNMADEIDERIDAVQVDLSQELREALDRLDDPRIVQLVDIELVERQLIEPLSLSCKLCRQFRPLDVQQPCQTDAAQRDHATDSHQKPVNMLAVAGIREKGRLREEVSELHARRHKRPDKKTDADCKNRQDH